jgi:V8-like Glu-specific endopeptidase
LRHAYPEDSVKVRRLLLGVLVAVPLPLPLPGPPAASAAPAAGPRTRVVASLDLGSVSYWTATRMARATPLGRRTIDEAPASDIPTARAVPGSRVIGALFFNNGAGPHYCTASVVRTPKRNMLLTAAHCLYNQSAHVWHRRIVFVPRYSAGHRPYGTWPVWLMVADKRWIERGDPDLDYGFAAVQVMGGRRLADVVGANELQINQGYTNRVLVAGYPAKENNPADRPVGCAGRTYRQARFQLRFDCHGFFGGTSGSPWLSDYDARTESGHVIGVIGGYQEGGSEEWRSYSPLFTEAIAHLLDTANDQA